MKTTVAPLEQQLNGVEGMSYMSSTAQSTGAWNIMITFEPGTDVNIAQVMVQNKVAQAQSRVPKEVRDLGITVRKRTPDILMSINLVSRGERATNLISNYAITRYRQAFAHIRAANLSFGAKEYSMRYG
jgi:multidrug efflux pump subunit AcrB